MPQFPYEVEIRYRFKSCDEACDKIPFLKDTLREKKTWQSRIFGKPFFMSGRLLRIGIVLSGEKPEYFLCLKGPDIGSFANVRQEIEEVITGGINRSIILKQLGAGENAGTPAEVVRELDRLGYSEFMSFRGVDTYGRYTPEDIGIKMMSCPELRWPLMVELEKIAFTEDEAEKSENDLKELDGRLGIGDRRVIEEPPTILYNSLFG